jgi:hypothetical protein
MSDQLKGVITKISPVEERPYNDKVYKSRKFRIKTQEQYPQVFEMEVAEAKMSMLDSYKEGDQVAAHINLRGREWSKGDKEGVFLSIQCWKLEKDGAGGTSYSANSNEADKELLGQQSSIKPLDYTNNDLPF